MNNLCDFSQSRRSRLGEVTLWAVAAAAMLSVHAGAAIYMMQPVPKLEGDDSPPPAMMIELAALPEALNVEDTTESTDAVDSAEVQSDTTQPVEDVTPPELVVEDVKIPEPQPEPVQEVAEPQVEEVPEPIEDIDPIENQMMAALENVEVPLPVLRPPPPPKEEEKVVERKKPETKPTPEKKKPELAKPKPPASKASETSKAAVTQSNRSVASASGGATGSSAAEISKWESRVRSAISRRKPRSLRANGLTSSVQFRVADNGSLSGVSIVRSTGDSAIDRQIISWVSGVGRVPAPPPGAAKTVTIPIAIR